MRSSTNPSNLVEDQSVDSTSDFIGAMPRSGGTHFRVWAPSAKSVEVVLENGRLAVPLKPESSSYFSETVERVQPGNHYKFRLDGGEAFPDPASRYQPDGPHGASEIVDPCAFAWSQVDKNWSGKQIEGQVLYELHIGTFTQGGTFKSAIRDFPRLRDLGITVLECMPLSEFAGESGWGYDGVSLFAPYHRYGSPDDLRHMIDAAHQHGLAVILDVVYNHLGPDGNYLSKYSNDYFSKAGTEWGNAINFDGSNSSPVRFFFLANAVQWIRDYHFDGLRLDATQSIHDNGAHGLHIVAEISQAVRKAAGHRKTIMVAENEPQDSCLVRPIEKNGFGLDAVWNDDFHHSAVVALTGRREGYFGDHLGKPQEFISAAKYGYLYQGQYYDWQNSPRGTSSLSIPASAFVTFLENHDQVANFGRAQHLRTISSPARYRAVTGLWLLGPGTPMFFQGQEYGAETPFYYFAGHKGDLAEAVREGRRQFMLQFANQDTAEMRSCLKDPAADETFLASRLNPDEFHRHPEVVKMHADLLRVRREDLSPQTAASCRVDGAVLAENCFVLRYLTASGNDRLLIVNLGAGLDLPHLPEPLTAPPAGKQWKLKWSSESPNYGGSGASEPGRFGAWHVVGESTLFLEPSQGAFHSEEPKNGNLG
jgi:maltooligosyltrehalose trehalohydrolase